MNDFPRGTVTFLFTDLEGSTGFWERSPRTMPSVYARHDALLREAVSARGGVIFKVIGDAMQAAFPTAPEGVSAALAAQAALVSEVWPPTSNIRVRMALHVAAVEPDNTGDYRAPELNRLGRLLAAGHGGQVLLSLATAELTRDRLPPGTELRDLGEHRLTDLYRPEQVFQLTHRALPATFPPLRTLENRANNLPLQPTLLIGREDEVSAIQALLAREGVRLVTLTGPGGTGKTRLALQVAADQLGNQPDGVWFVSLTSIADHTLVAQTIAETLGLREMVGRGFSDTLTTYLSTRRLLLLLDNFEHVVEGAPLIAELLAACPTITVLTTSRTPLHLRGEHELPVPPLSLPDPRQTPTREVLPQYEAVRLFIDRARDVKPDFAVTNDNAPSVAAICHRLDGLPLALELAAARIRVLPPAAMLTRLEQRLLLLTGGSRDLPARQRTLRATIAWSYDLLGPGERALFRLLAVFVGGCTLEAAETVAGHLASNHMRATEVLDGLALLVSHNLLRQEERAGEGWFRMLETIREFGLEQLAANEESLEIQKRHATYFHSFAEAADLNLRGPNSRAWVRRVEAEYDNLRAALSWTIAHGEPRMSLQLRTTIYRLWLTRGYISDRPRPSN